MLPTRALRGHHLAERESRIAPPSSSSIRIDAAGTASDGKAYRALVRNRAQLAYQASAHGLRATAAPPAKVAASADLAAQLKLQDTAAQRMVGGRFQHGALDLETIETPPGHADRSGRRHRAASKRIAPPRSLKSSWSRPTASSRAPLRAPASPPFAASCALPSAGTASSNWPQA